MKKKRFKEQTTEEIAKINLSTEKLYLKDEMHEMSNFAQQEESFSSNPEFVFNFFNAKSENTPLGFLENSKSIIFRTDSDIPKGKPIDGYILSLNDMIQPGDFFIHHSSNKSFSVIAKSTSRMLPDENTKKIVATSNNTLIGKGITPINTTFLKELQQKPNPTFLMDQYEVNRATFINEKSKPISSAHPLSSSETKTEKKEQPTQSFALVSKSINTSEINGIYITPSEKDCLSIYKNLIESSGPLNSSNFSIYSFNNNTITDLIPSNPSPENKKNLFNLISEHGTLISPNVERYLELFDNNLNKKTPVSLNCEMPTPSKCANEYTFIELLEDYAKKLNFSNHLVYCDYNRPILERIPFESNDISKKHISELYNFISKIENDPRFVKMKDSSLINKQSPSYQKFKESFRKEMKSNNTDSLFSNIQNSNSMSTDPKNQKFGLAKIHQFEENAEKGTRAGYAYNITLFEKDVQKILPAEGKLRLYVMNDPSNPDKFTITNTREKADYPNTKLVLDLDPKAFKKDGEIKLQSKDGYIDLTAVKMNGRDSFSVYQHDKDAKNNTYIGFAAEPSHGVYVGNAFKNKPENGFEYTSIAADPQKLNLDKNSFINVHKPEDPSKAMLAFSADKPSSNAEIIVQISKKGKEILNSLPNNQEIRLSVSSRNPDNITPQVNFSDLNVFIYNKDTKERTYLGSAWSNEKFNSLPQDVQNAIANNTRPQISTENNTSLNEKFKVGEYVEFSFPKDYYLNTAIEKGIIDSPTAIGLIKEVGDKSITVDSPVGTVKIDIPVSKETTAVISESNKLNFTQFSDSYSMLKSQIDESLKPKKESKQTQGKTESKSNEKSEDKGKSTSKSKSKSSKKGEEMSM